MPLEEMAILAPVTAKIEIGGKAFEQRPLSLRRTTAFLTLLSEEASRVVANGDFGALEALDASNWAAALPVMVSVLGSLPGALPRLMAFLLSDARTVEEIDPELVDFIADNGRPVDALKVIRTLVEQNDPEEIVSHFFALRGMLTKSQEQ